MRVRRLDSNHDWTFGGGLRNYAMDSAAIKQNVVTALLSLYNNWFLDVTHGVRWFNYLKKNPDINAMEIELKTTILNVTGVVRLTAFSISLDTETRKCTVTAAYTDIFGNNQEASIDSPGY